MSIEYPFGSISLRQSSRSYRGARGGAKGICFLTTARLKIVASGQFVFRDRPDSDGAASHTTQGHPRDWWNAAIRLMTH